ncbi:peptidylprolyl isomerase [Inquilinus sp. Marseille-Q2685]|uniref:peptidylprolyl isomerase n=1 Tax=Inquilinus sp. Marseille-Q2685 TaxID=2866581 RepID=UPI001CE4668D|nr:peptidylprolyl isomerase [Inquilinus sp. Marseille-Q2685]
MRRVPVLLALLALGAAPAAAQQPPAEPVARMGAIGLSPAEVEAFLRGLDPQVLAQAATSREALDGLIRAELTRRAVVAEAAKAGWADRPEVAARIEQARQQVIVDTWLAARSEPPAGDPPDADLRRIYDDNTARFVAPAEMHLAQIFLPVPPGASEAEAKAAEDRIGELRRRARARGADFAALARQASQHKDSADKGGDMGWLSEDALIPEIREAVAGLEKGAVSTPIRSQAGWHLIRLVDRKASRVQGFDEVRPLLVQALRRQQAADLRRQYIEGLVGAAPPAINEIAVTEILSRLAPAAPAAPSQ